MTTSQKVKLTEAFIRSITPPKEGKRLFLDTERRGFGLSVSAQSKSYLCIRRVPGHGQVWYRFGHVGEITVAEARKQAEGILARMAIGENPVAQRRKAREEERREKVRGITLRQGVALALATLRAKGRAPRTIEKFGRPVEMYLADWLDKPLAEITRADTRERHQNLAAEIARGKYIDRTNPKHRGRKRGNGSGFVTANNVFRVFRAVYNRALREHPELPANPCINVDWFNAKTKRAAIPTESLADWYKAAMKMENAVRRDHLMFLLFSGMRREASSVMRWEDVDFRARSMRVPRPKGGEQRAFDLPLSDFLIEILQRRRAEHEKVCAGERKMLPWVWPAASASGHIEEPREEFEGLKWTPHDLRRTFITAATLGCKLHPFDVKLLVNHALPSGDITANYVTPSLEQLRIPMQAVTDKLRVLCVGEQKSRKVVRIGSRSERA